MIKIEFPAANKALAAALGRALSEYGESATRLDVPTRATVDAALEGVLHKANEEAPEHDDGLPEAYERDAPLTEAGLDALAEQGAHTPPPSDVRVDLQGVPFDRDYCADAADPFYKSGANKGQWKKRQGVDVERYNVWYESMRPLAAEQTPPTTDPMIQDGPQAGAAFSSQQGTPPTTDAPGASADPTDGGGFMKWIAERQTAGTLVTAQVQAAYASNGVDVADLFGPNGAAVVAGLVATLKAQGA